MDPSAIKTVGLFFIFTFTFFALGQLLWTYGIFFDAPLLGSEERDQVWSSHAFTVSSIFGLIASVKLYRAAG